MPMWYAIILLGKKQKQLPRCFLALQLASYSYTASYDEGSQTVSDMEKQLVR